MTIIEILQFPNGINLLTETGQCATGIGLLFTIACVMFIFYIVIYAIDWSDIGKAVIQSLPLIFGVLIMANFILNVGKIGGTHFKNSETYPIDTIDEIAPYSINPDAPYYTEIKPKIVNNVPTLTITYRFKDKPSETSNTYLYTANGFTLIDESPFMTNILEVTNKKKDDDK